MCLLYTVVKAITHFSTGYSLFTYFCIQATCKGLYIVHDKSVVRLCSSADCCNLIINFVLELPELVNFELTRFFLELSMGTCAIYNYLCCTSV